MVVLIRVVKKIDLGPAGLNVARSVRQYRQHRRLSYAELSRRLDGLNRRIPPLGLRQLEAGKRRVDVDDPVALSLALDVSPLALLLPHRIEPTGAALSMTGGTPAVSVSEATESIYRMATIEKEATTDGDD